MQTDFQHRYIRGLVFEKITGNRGSTLLIILECINRSKELETWRIFICYLFIQRWRQWVTLVCKPQFLVGKVFF